RWPRSGPRRMTARAVLTIRGPRPSWLAIFDRSRLRATDRDLLLWRHLRNDRRCKIRTRKRCDALAELLSQMARAHLLDRAFRQIAELERTERHPDQPIDREPEMAEHVLDLTVLALPHRKHEPHIGPLLAFELRVDRPIAHAVDGDAAAQLVEARLLHAAVCAHAVAAQPAGRRQLQHARQRAIVGEEKKPLGIHVEAADAD